MIHVKSRTFNKLGGKFPLIDASQPHYFSSLLIHWEQEKKGILFFMSHIKGSTHHLYKGIVENLTIFYIGSTPTKYSNIFLVLIFNIKFLPTEYNKNYFFMLIF